MGVAKNVANFSAARIFASMAGFRAHAKVLLWNPEFKSAMPESRDFEALEQLPSAAAFAKQVKGHAAAFRKSAPKKKPASKK